MARRKVIPIQDSLGRVSRRSVNVANLGDYGRVVTNNRGRVAYVKKSSEVRALEIVRGEGRGLRRIKIRFAGKYEAKVTGPDGEIYKDRNRRLKLEASLTFTVPAGDAEDVMADLEGWAKEQAAAFGIDPEDFDLHVITNEPAPGSFVGVEVAEVMFHGKRTPPATEALELHAKSLLEGLRGMEGTGDEEMAEVLQRAEQLTDRRGRSYWVDPVTGRRTLNPELIQ